MASVANTLTATLPSFHRRARPQLLHRYISPRFEVSASFSVPAVAILRPRIGLRIFPQPASSAGLSSIFAPSPLRPRLAAGVAQIASALSSHYASGLLFTASRRWPERRSRDGARRTATITARNTPTRAHFASRSDHECDRHASPSPDGKPSATPRLPHASIATSAHDARAYGNIFSSRCFLRLHELRESVPPRCADTCPGRVDGLITSRFRVLARCRYYADIVCSHMRGVAHKHDAATPPARAAFRGRR